MKIKKTIPTIVKNKTIADIIRTTFFHLNLPSLSFKLFSLSFELFSLALVFEKLILFDIDAFTSTTLDFAYETSPFKRFSPLTVAFLTCDKVSTNAGSTDKYNIIPRNEQIMYTGPNIPPIAVFKADILNNAIIAIAPMQNKLTIFKPSQERIIAIGKITSVLTEISVKPNKEIVSVTNIVFTKVESNKTVNAQNKTSINELTVLWIPLKRTTNAA